MPMLLVVLERIEPGDDHSTPLEIGPGHEQGRLSESSMRRMLPDSA
jgi:hypothetical protein